jgi:hypothetical protein
MESTHSTQSFWESVPPMKTVTQHQRTTNLTGSRHGRREARRNDSLKPEGNADGLQRTNPGNMKLGRTGTNSEMRYWVTDDEEEETDSETESKKNRTDKREERSPGWWRLVLQGLPRLKIRSEKQWRIGERCLVMTGKAGLDEGQVAVITERKPCMVEIAFRGPDGNIRRKSKRAGSLIGLRPGVTVVQDADGSVWVQPEKRNWKRRKDQNSQE